MRRLSVSFRLLLSLVVLLPLTTEALPPELHARLQSIYGSDQYHVNTVGTVRWLAGDAYVLAQPSATGKGQDVVKFEPASGRRTVLVTSAQLVPSGKTEPLSIDDFAMTPDETRVLFFTNTHKTPMDLDVADLWLFDRQSRTLSRLADVVEGPGLDDILSPDGTHAVWVKDSNLYVKNLAGGEPTTLTTDGADGQIENGASYCGDGVMHWSPDSQRIAYEQSDCRPTGLFPILNETEANYPQPRYVRFSGAGTPIAPVRLGVISAAGGATHWIDLPGDTYYIDEFNWNPDARGLLIQKLSRARDLIEVFQADLSSGTLKPVLHEQDHAWVRDSKFDESSGFQWIRGGRAFTWLSELHGWRRSYVISSDGQRRTAVTPDNADAISNVKADDPGGWLYYIASPDNATQRYLYRARLDGKGHAERVTPSNEPGTHTYDMAPDARWALHTYSTADTPPVTELIELPSHRSVRVLEDNHAIKAKLKDWGTRPTEFYKLDIGNGVVMDGWVLKPRDFDPAKQYPVFIFVYGEPWSQTVLDSWSIGQGHQLFHRAVADAGYLVISIDNRGTPAPKGTAWRRVVFGSLGPLSTEEQAAGLREFGRTHPYADLSRVGIWGWSAGGTNTLNALFRKPDQYQVGIAVVPKPRPDLYNAGFQEIYMRSPQENPEGFRLAAPINYAQGLKGHLLIVTGTGETNTHIQIIEHLINRLVELDKPFDEIVYPNRNHDMHQGEGTRLHLFDSIAGYLTEHLPAGPR